MPKGVQVAVVLVTHAPLGQALVSCAQHVLQRAPDVLVADILPTDFPEPWIDQLTSDVRATEKSHVLILCDLYGSTPYHIAAGLQRRLTIRGKLVHLMSGVNVCMLLKAVTDRSETPEQYIENVLYATERGIVHQAPTTP